MLPFSIWIGEDNKLAKVSTKIKLLFCKKRYENKACIAKRRKRSFCEDYKRYDSGMVYMGQVGPTLIFREQLRPTWSFAMVKMFGKFLSETLFPKDMTWKAFACVDISAKQTYLIKSITFIIFIIFCLTYAHQKDNQSWNTFERSRVFVIFCTSKKDSNLKQMYGFHYGH